VEKRRRELSMRTDFNLKDAYYMFKRSQGEGIEVDDLAQAMKSLGVISTKDELFILFYRLDTSKTSQISYNEFMEVLCPRQHEYGVLLQARDSFHGPKTQLKDYFSQLTRDLLKNFVRGLIDCEVSVEVIK
jgi:EF-hand domain pair